MNVIFLWAQSLDNSSPDKIYFDGKILNPQRDFDERKRIISSISQVTLNSKSTEVSASVTIYVRDDDFVLSIILPEKDVLNRKAPVLCYSQLTGIDDPFFEKRLIAHISIFVKKIGRSLPSSIQQEVISALSLAKKKRPKKFTITWILVALFLLSLFLLFCYIFLFRTI